MLPTWENLSDPIFTHAAERPNQPAVVEGPTNLTYGALAVLVGKASLYLKSMGIGPGERVGVALTGRSDHFVLLFALLRVGAQLTELPASEPLDVALIQRLGIGRVFVEPNAALSAIPLTRIDANWREELVGFTGDARHDAVGDAVATITLSSGSTGTPRGVALTHRQLFERYHVAVEIFAQTGAHAYGKAPPFVLATSLSNYGFFRNFICQIASGGAVVPLPEYRHSIDLAFAVRNQGEAVLTATANMARAFLAAAPTTGLLLPRLKALIAIGQPLFADEKRALAKRVTPNFYDNYGAAGIGGITCLKPHEVAAHAGSVGRPVPGMEVEVVDSHGAPLPASAVGRVRCRSVTAARGLVGETSSRDEGFVDGWYYPGELASLDTEGYLHIAGRSVELIKRGASEFLPPEIEAVITNHPAVLDAAVVARPVAGGGEVVIAFVVLKHNVPQRELIQHCANRLPPDRRPDRIVVLDTMPKLSGGKTDRTRLKTGALRPIARPGGSGRA